MLKHNPVVVVTGKNNPLSMKFVASLPNLIVGVLINSLLEKQFEGIVANGWHLVVGVLPLLATPLAS